MKNRREVSASFTFAEAKTKVQDSVILAGVVMASVFPMFLYQFTNLTAEVFTRTPTANELRMLALGQSIIVFGAAFLCSLVGFMYAKRLKLPGFGKLSDVKFWLPVGLMAGLVFAPVSYFMIDKKLLAMMPDLLPSPWYQALGWMAGSTLGQEVIARFGLMTIGVYLLDWVGFSGRPWPAIVVVSVFGALSSFIFLQRLGIINIMGPVFLATSVGFSFLFQALLSWVYIKKGLVASMCLHFGVLLRLLVYSVISPV